MYTAIIALHRLGARLERLRKEDGASAVEYGLLVALIAALIVAAVLMFGDFIAGIFKDTCTAIESGMGTNAVSADCT